MILTNNEARRTRLLRDNKSIDEAFEYKEIKEENKYG